VPDVHREVKGKLETSKVTRPDRNVFQRQR
jgi:hypothetical protein